MAELEQEVQNALAALAQEAEKKPCGCNDTAAAGDALDIFGAEESPAPAGLAAQLDMALNSVRTEDWDPFAASGELTVEAALEFAEVEAGPQLSLNELLALVEKYPGLKITFSY